MVGGASLQQFALFGVVLFAGGGGIGISEAYGSTLIAAFLDGCDSRLTGMHRGGRVCLTVRAGSMLPTEALALPLAKLLARAAPEDLAETAELSRCLFVGPVSEIAVPAGSRPCDESCSERRRWLQQEQLRRGRWGNIGDSPPEKLVAVAVRAHSGLHRLWLSETNTSPFTVGCSLTCRGVAIWSDRSTGFVDPQSDNEFGESSKQQLRPSRLWRTLASRSGPAEVPLERSPTVAALAISACSSERSPESRPREAKAVGAVGGARDSANWTRHGENKGGIASRLTIDHFAVFARRLRRNKLDDDVIISHGTTTPTDVGLVTTATKGDKAETVLSSSQDSGVEPTAESTSRSPTAGDGLTMPTRHVPHVMAGEDDSLKPMSERQFSFTAALFSASGTGIENIANRRPATTVAYSKEQWEQGVTGGWPQADAGDGRAISNSRSINAPTPPSLTPGLSRVHGLVELTTDSSPATQATMATDMPSTLPGGIAVPPTIALTSYFTSSLGNVALSSASASEANITSNTGAATDSSGDDTRPPFYGSSSSVTLLWPVGDNLTSTTVANVSVQDSLGSTAAEDGRSLAPPRTSEQTSASPFVPVRSSGDTAASSQATTPTAEFGKWPGSGVTGSGEDRGGGGADVEAIAAGVTVAAAVLIGAGAAAYIWYRKKYPVRMPIGRKFVTHSNPEYKVPPIPMVTLVKDEV